MKQQPNLPDSKELIARLRQRAEYAKAEERLVDRCAMTEAADLLDRMRAALNDFLDFHNEGRIPTADALARAEEIAAD